MKLSTLVQHLVVIVGLSIAATAPAADKKKAAPPMDEKAAMAAMVKAATPGEAHKTLEPLVGSFDAKAKQWMDPSKPPEESNGSCERKWILDNRYIQEQYNGNFGGQPFTGMGYEGYDNVTKKYVATWIDSMGTGMTLSSGAMAGNVLKMTGTMSDPVTGKTSKYTMVTTIADNDHHRLEMWAPGPDGKNMKWMEISFTRKK